MHHPCATQYESIRKILPIILSCFSLTLSLMVLFAFSLSLHIFLSLTYTHSMPKALILHQDLFSASFLSCFLHEMSTVWKIWLTDFILPDINMHFMVSANNSFPCLLLSNISRDVAPAFHSQNWLRQHGMKLRLTLN